MLSKEENEMLTQVGPGTPAGEMLRRYWIPVGISDELKDVPQKVRFLCEDLVLYRDPNNNPLIRLPITNVMESEEALLD